MQNYLIDFKNIYWENPARGVRYKAYVKGNQRVQLAESKEKIIEEDWFTKGRRIGYILKGSISIESCLHLEQVMDSLYLKEKKAKIRIELQRAKSINYLV